MPISLSELLKKRSSSNATIPPVKTASIAGGPVQNAAVPVASDSRSSIIPQDEKRHNSVPVKHATTPVANVDQRADVKRVDAESMERILQTMEIKPARIREAMARADITREPLPVIMRDFGFLSQEKVAEALSLQSGLPYFPPDRIDAIDIVGLRAAGISVDAYTGTVPVGFDDGALLVGIDDLSKVNDALNAWHEYSAKVVIASNDTLQAVFRRVFAHTERDWDATFETFISVLRDRHIDVDENPQLLRNLLGALVRHACYVGASDIQIYRTEQLGVIKFRIDGVGRIFRSIPIELHERLLQKLTMDTNISIERLRREPQEAVFSFNGDDAGRYPDLVERYSFRLEIGETPTRGRSATIRVLDKESAAADIKRLGFESMTLQALLGYTETSEGLVVVTGPTGSGKTTTLYALLNQVDPVERSVQTIENPIEYRHGLWMQYEVFRHAESEAIQASKILKGLLRNDPDVMLVGEVRDGDAAEVLIHAANTGHLVFTTLHANSAPTAIARLREMNVNMGSLSSVLLGILAQRLVRVLCQHCRITDEREETLTALASAPYINMKGKAPNRAIGCINCGYAGYRGRRAIYELLHIGSTIRELIETNASISRISAEGVRQGHDLWSCGLKLVADGVTSIDEVRRVTSERG